MINYDKSIYKKFNPIPKNIAKFNFESDFDRFFRNNLIKSAITVSDIANLNFLKNNQKNLYNFKNIIKNK